jgi:malate dehydrogenase (oxaloacetate-decarboxylating)
MYVGNRHARIRGDRYDAFIDAYVKVASRLFPHALLQWEDFAKEKAFRLLDRYAERILSFDDDIQGTGATAAAVLISAMRIKDERMRDQRFAIVGMGQAGTGIATDILSLLIADGLSEEEARKRIFAVDFEGLLTDDMPSLSPYQRKFAQAREVVKDWSGTALRDVVKHAKPTVLVGVTAKHGLFDRELLEQMAKNDPRPVILALSNPTSKAECTPDEVAAATHGGGLVATGSPFPGTAQCNNMFIFPGVGLGALVSDASKVTPEMFHAASHALSALAPAGRLLPDLSDIRNVSFHVAKAVACEARDSGLGRLLSDESFEDAIRRAQWVPHYYAFRPGHNGHGL